MQEPLSENPLNFRRCDFTCRDAVTLHFAVQSRSFNGQQISGFRLISFAVKKRVADQPDFKFLNFFLQHDTVLADSFFKRFLRVKAFQLLYSL